VEYDETMTGKNRRDTSWLNKGFQEKKSEINTNRETAEDALCYEITGLKDTPQKRYCQHGIHTGRIMDMFQ
jgi:hypothetical protein